MDDKAARRRRIENDAVKKRMDDPEDNLCHTGLNAFRWAPRKLIEKDKREMARAHGEDHGESK